MFLRPDRAVRNVAFQGLRSAAPSRATCARRRGGWCFVGGVPQRRTRPAQPAPNAQLSPLLAESRLAKSRHRCFMAHSAARFHIGHAAHDAVDDFGFLPSEGGQGIRCDRKFVAPGCSCDPVKSAIGSSVDRQSDVSHVRRTGTVQSNGKSAAYSSSNNPVCSTGFGGGFLPIRSYAFAHAIRPRGVRMMKPCCIR